MDAHAGSATLDEPARATLDDRAAPSTLPGAPDPRQDAALVRAARRGDREAFERLVRRHLAVANGVAIRIMADPHDAQDVVQDAFVSALRKLDTCRRPEHFRAWLLAIVRNAAYNALNARRVRATEPLAAEPAHADPAADTEGGVWRRELRERVTGALDALSALQRSVVLLHDYEGWGHKEIAEKLGITPGSSRVHLHGARTRLRERLGDVWPFGGRR